MTVGAANKSALTGPKLVQAFLEEVSSYVRRTPSGRTEGTAQEIVWDVVADTERFSGCSSKSINDLSRQLAMAVQAHGRRYGIRYERLSGGRIRVAVA